MSGARAHVEGSGRRRETTTRRAVVPTELEAFVSAEGRDEAVERVRERIDREGITYVYYQFPSVTGRIMGKGVPAKHWERIAEKGFQLVYGATANLFVDRHGDYIGYGPEAAELVGVPEPETFAPLPWDSKVARVWCQCFRNREERKDPGAVLTSDSRANLKRLQADFEKRTGLHLRAGTEPEMMWLKLKPDGTPDVDGVTKPYCYHIDQFSELQPIIHKVIEYGQALGLDMIQGDHEDAPGQIELNFEFDRAESHGGQPLDLPSGLQAGRSRARGLPLLHAEAVHGRLGERVSPQHLPLARRRERVRPGHRRPAEAEPARPLRDRRDPRASRRAHGDHGVDGQLVPPPLGHRASGRRSSRTGATRTGRPRFACPHPAASSTGRSTRPSTRTCPSRC